MPPISGDAQRQHHGDRRGGQVALSRVGVRARRVPVVHAGRSRYVPARPVALFFPFPRSRKHARARTESDDRRHIRAGCLAAAVQGRCWWSGSRPFVKSSATPTAPPSRARTQVRTVPPAAHSAHVRAAANVTSRARVPRRAGIRQCRGREARLSSLPIPTPFVPCKRTGPRRRAPNVRQKRNKAQQVHTTHRRMRLPRPSQRRPRAGPPAASGRRTTTHRGRPGGRGDISVTVDVGAGWGGGGGRQRSLACTSIGNSGDGIARHT